MYKLTDNIQCKLKKITPKVLKEAKSFGIDSIDISIIDNFKNFSEAFFDTEKLRKILNLLFEYDFSNIKDEELEEIDLEEVSRAFIDFFLKLSMSITESESFKRILKNLS